MASKVRFTEIDMSVSMNLRSTNYICNQRMRATFPLVAKVIIKCAVIIEDVVLGDGRWYHSVIIWGFQLSQYLLEKCAQASSNGFYIFSLLWMICVHFNA